MPPTTQTWYTYTSGGRSGPFSFDAVRDKLSRGELSPSDFAWAQGMPDWKRIAEIEAFAPSVSSLSLVPPLSSVAPAETRGTASGITPASASFLIKPGPEVAAVPDGTRVSDLKSRAEPKKAGGAVFESPTTYTPVNLVAKAPERPTTAAMTRAPFPSQPIRPSPSAVRGFSAYGHGRSWWIKLIFVAGVAGVLFYAVLTYVDPKSILPQRLFASWFTSIPTIHEISPADYQTLLEAASADPGKGIRIELAVSSTQPQTSVLYLATNMADGTQLDVRFAPIPATLAADPIEVQPISLSVKRKFARSPALSFLPGYYWVKIFSASDGSPVFNSKVFLGGSPDLDYRTRLHDYEAVRRGKAKAELDSLHDFASKLEEMLTADDQATSGLSGLKNRLARKRAWGVFDPTWNRMYRDAATAEAQAKPVFFPQLRARAEALEKAVIELHNSNQILVEPPLPTTARPSLDDASSALSPAAIAAAQALATAQIVSEKARVELTDLKARINGETQRLGNSVGYFEGESSQ